VGHEVRADRAAVIRRYDLPLSDAASTWIALAQTVPLDELVVAGDHFLLEPYQLDPHDSRPYVSLDELRTAVSLHHGRGAKAAASALQLVRPGAESRMESLLRLLLGRDGLPEPELNQDVYSNAGKWLGRVDLFYRQYRTIVEYDGEGHRVDKATNERDQLRRENFVNAGFAPIHVRAAGLFQHPRGTVDRVRAALMRGGWHGESATEPSQIDPNRSK
jgi:hypothetical protein